MKVKDWVKSLDDESLAELLETAFYIGRTLWDEWQKVLNDIDKDYDRYWHERNINFMLEFYVWLYRQVAVEASYLTDMYNLLDSKHQFYAMYEKYCMELYLW